MTAGRRVTAGRWACVLLLLAGCGPVDTGPADGDLTETTKCYWRHTCFQSVQSYDQKQIAVTLDYKGSDEPFSVLVTTTQSGMQGAYQPETRLVLQAPQRVALLSLTAANPDSYNWSWQFQQHPGDTPAIHDDSVIYRLPYRDGDAYPVLQGYGGSYSHTGDNAYSVDWAMPVGTPVLAARGGVVAEVRGDSDKKGRGAENYVLIRHSDGTYGWYLHLRQNGAAVAAGDVVRAGDLIGHSGDTGYSREPHLHFQVSSIVDTPGHLYQSFPTRFATAGGVRDDFKVGEEPVAITDRSE